jgi:hypothetical protein
MTNPGTVGWLVTARVFAGQVLHQHRVIKSIAWADSTTAALAWTAARFGGWTRCEAIGFRVRST